MAAKKSKATKSNNNALPVSGFTPYKAKKGEEYMNDAQKDHFRSILNAWKKELMEEVDRTVDHMKSDAANFADPSDRATQDHPTPGHRPSGAHRRTPPGEPPGHSHQRRPLRPTRTHHP